MTRTEQTKENQANSLGRNNRLGLCSLSVLSSYLPIKYTLWTEALHSYQRSGPLLEVSPERNDSLGHNLGYKKLMNMAAKKASGDGTCRPGEICEEKDKRG